MIRKFEEFVYESDAKKVPEYQGDEYSKLDGTYKNLEITNVSNDELLKQYVVFSELTKLPPTFGDPLFSSSKKRRLFEGLKETVDVDDAIESIQKNYKLADWQIDTVVAENSIRVILYIPDRADNVKLVVGDMVNMGYYVCDSFRQTKNGKTYMTLRFDPRYPKDMTDEVKKMRHIYHITPKYNLESIKENGFIPQHENKVFNYPPRLHFIKEYTGFKNVIKLGEQLCDTNTNKLNNGEYVILTLDVKKIPMGVEFIGDSCYKFGICTEGPIPYDAVISTDEVKFKK